MIFDIRRQHILTSHPEKPFLLFYSNVQHAETEKKTVIGLKCSIWKKTLFVMTDDEMKLREAKSYLGINIVMIIVLSHHL